MTEDMQKDKSFPPGSHRVFLSLGSNMGDPEANLLEATREITGLSGVVILRTSSVYLTEPQGVRDQPWFANQVLELTCNALWTPETLLKAVLNLELLMGRTRDVRWGPRLIDIDLLLFDTEVRNTEKLQLPHPRMSNRAFVLVPLAEIAPELRPGPQTRTVKELLEEIPHEVEGAVITQPS